MRKKLLSILFAGLCIVSLSLGAVEARAGGAANLAITWGLDTTVQQNFDFGNAANTSLTNLPGQVQGNIFAGILETYIMSALLFGF